VELGTLLAGRYEVLERLGRGGMGEVWAARDRTLRRQVALKLLPVGAADAVDDLSARFEREAVAAAQINHPNVVALHDRGVHEGMLFLVMELVDGMSLSELISASGVLAASRAMEIAEQICAALEATHRAGVVHFDIKPQNVMITPAGTAKVVDFGIAGLVQAQQLSVIHSSRLAPAATLEYAAPEQFTTERGDERSDLYALGGVLFAMLTGHAPFSGPTASAATKPGRSTTMPPPSPPTAVASARSSSTSRRWPRIVSSTRPTTRRSPSRASQTTTSPWETRTKPLSICARRAISTSGSACART
jgi:serine/threonine protein kinase